MSQFDCIFVNGDSYSQEMTDSKVYANYIGESFNLPVINKAVAGSSNKRILRSSVEYINELVEDGKTPLIIIGWSFIRRIEVWYYGNSRFILNRIPDKKDNANYLKTITLDWLVNSEDMTLAHKSLINDDLEIHKALLDFYLDLYLLKNFVQSKNLKYLFFSAARNTDCPLNCFPDITTQNFVTDVAADPQIYKLHEFCVMHWAFENDPECNSVTGHLSESGHKQFSNFMLTLIKNL
jgi:hypothetical protein